MAKNKERKLEDLYLKLTSRNSATTNLDKVRVKGEGALVVFFRSTYENIYVHRIKGVPFSSYYLCQGESDCRWCQSGNPQLVRIVAPVYNGFTKSTQALSITDSTGQDDLLPQIAPYFENIESPPTKAIFIRMDDFYKYEVRESKWPGDNSIDKTIEDFNKLYDQGKIKLTQIFKNLPNNQIEKIPQVAERLRLFGF